MDVLETQRSSSFINADEREPQLSNTSRPISTQSRIGKNTQCRKRNDKQIFTIIFFIHIFMMRLLNFEEDDTLSYHANIYDILTK